VGDVEAERTGPHEGRLYLSLHRRLSSAWNMEVVMTHYALIIWFALFAIVVWHVDAEAGIGFYESIYDPDNPCRNFIDEDNDGLMDWNDPSCNPIGRPSSWWWAPDWENGGELKKFFSHRERTACSDGGNNDFVYNLNNPPYPGAPAWDGVDFDGGYHGSRCYKFFKEATGVEWPTVEDAIANGMGPCLIDTDGSGGISYEESKAAPWRGCQCYAPKDPQCVVPSRETEGRPGRGNCGLLGIEPFLLLGWPLWRRWR
jgi:hypothetical protein